MSKPIKLDLYSPQEEVANAVTHLIGVLTSLFGLATIFLDQGRIDKSTFWSTTIFLLSSALLYSASSAYHLAKTEKRKRLFKQFDHMAIYVLIAGTFTPFSWGILGNEAFGINMTIAVWSIALAGIAFKLFYTGRYEKISLISYLGMGWLGVLMFGKIGEVLGAEAVNYMIYGGIAYSLGVVFYLMRKVKYHHAIWHLFVLAGTGLHAYSILSFVLPYSN